MLMICPRGGEDEAIFASLLGRLLQLCEKLFIMQVNTLGKKYFPYFNPEHSQGNIEITSNIPYIHIQRCSIA